MRYRALHWSVQDGLSQGTNYDMIKDINGFLWIGSQHGLNRFDGSSFKKYFMDKARKSNTVAGDQIYGLIEDSLHNIWIGTEQGLSRYDIRTDSFKNFYPDKPNSTIIPFQATKQEIFCWYYPDSQLVAFDIHSFKKRTLAHISGKDSLGFGISDHYPVYDEKTNSIWLARGRADAPDGGLTQIILATGEKKKFTWKCFLDIPKHSHGFEAMRYDRKRNSIWLASSDGLIEFSLTDNQFHHIEVFHELESLKDFHQWAGIDIDMTGKIWAATQPRGIFIYDPEKNSLSAAFPNDSNAQRSTEHTNVLLYCDRDGINWTGSWSADGIHQIIPFSESVKHYTIDKKIPHFISDFVVNALDAGNGKIWLGAFDGIDILDQHTGNFERLRVSDLKGIQGKEPLIFMACIDTISQIVWIYTNSLIYQMDMTTRICRPLVYKNKSGRLLTTDGPCIKFRQSGLITADMPDQTAIFLIDKDSAMAKQIISLPAGSTDFMKTCTDGDHTIFIRKPAAPVNDCYVLTNGSWTRRANPIDSLPWLRLVYNDRDKTYWIATEKLIYHYNSDFTQIKKYSDIDGLPPFEIYGMTTDNENNLWFNTEISICRLDLASGRIVTLSAKDGFEKQNFTPVLNMYNSSNGELFLGGGIFGAGFNRIFPSAYTSTPAFVYLQSFLINEKPARLPTGMNDFREIYLEYNENQLTIETGIIDYYSGGNSHIRYKLGETSDWQYPVNSARYTIHYEDIQPGTYKLYMQASNVSNEFAGPEKVLVIHISPPWWQTWWARTVFVAAFIFLLWQFIQLRSRNLKQRNIALEEKVMHRTQELKHSLEELRGTQAQLIQREKMASLGELTAGIAHEIQNPLNFVNNFSDLNRELLQEMKSEIEKGNYADAGAIAGDVMVNEDKINHHGRRAESIVKGMLLHSRTSTGEKEPVNLNALTDEYMRLSYHGLRAKDKSFNAILQTNFDPGLGKVNLNPQDIGRVLLNIFGNAFYAVNEKKKSVTEGYEPEIVVSTKNTGDKAEIRIRDNGTGIPAKVLDKIYQPFFTTKAPGEGTGLGLSISYDIVTKVHGGEMFVETEAGKFTEFKIILPL
jgi:signal transduction histidine kinase/ligand-binding sensor domain-containing protein